MGIVNASTHSFSDAGLYPTRQAQYERAIRLIEDGADVLDVGGESASPRKPRLSVDEECSLVVPLIEQIRRRHSIPLSVDTYKAGVAREALSAGASIINDISGLADLSLAHLAWKHDACLVIMHNRGIPKQYLLEEDLYTDVTTDVVGFLSERRMMAEQTGVSRERVILDPGPDFSKTPAQTVAILRNLGSVVALGSPVLLPISRKDFIGVVTGRTPAGRDAGTLAALDHGWRCGATLFRVHNVAAASRFIEAKMRLLRG